MKLKTKFIKRIGAYLAESRKDAGVSQGAMAKALGYKSNQYVSNIERGLVEPSMDYVKKAIKVCGIPKEEAVIFIQQTYVDQIKEALR